MSCASSLSLKIKIKIKIKIKSRKIDKRKMLVFKVFYNNQYVFSSRKKLFKTENKLLSRIAKKKGSS